MNSGQATSNRENILRLVRLYEKAVTAGAYRAADAVHDAIQRAVRPHRGSQSVLTLSSDGAIRSGGRQVTLWMETFPGGDTLRLAIRPQPRQTDVIVYWNRSPQTEHTFATREAAEAWGYAFHDVIMQDALDAASQTSPSETDSRLDRAS